MFVSAILLLTGILINHVPIARPVPLRKPFSSFPARIGDWEGRSEEYTDEILELLRVTDYMSRYYRRGANQVQVYVGYYDSQGAGRQIHSPKHCLPGGGWNVASQTTREVSIAGVGKMALVHAVYVKGGSRQLFVYWYRMKDTYITNEYLLKMRMILNSIRYQRNEATFVRFSTPLTGDENQAFEVIKGFMADFLPRLQEHLSQ